MKESNLAYSQAGLEKGRRRVVTSIYSSCRCILTLFNRVVFFPAKMESQHSKRQDRYSYNYDEENKTCIALLISHMQFEDKRQAGRRRVQSGSAIAVDATMTIIGSGGGHSKPPPPSAL